MDLNGYPEGSLLKLQSDCCLTAREQCVVCILTWTSCCLMRWWWYIVVYQALSDLFCASSLKQWNTKRHVMPLRQKDMSCHSDRKTGHATQTERQVMPLRQKDMSCHSDRKTCHATQLFVTEPTRLCSSYLMLTA